MLNEGLIDISINPINRVIFLTRMFVTALVTVSALSSNINCAQAASAQQNSKNDNLPGQSATSSTTKIQQDLQLRQRSAARLRGSFGPHVVGSEKTCFDPRRKQERVCADFEDRYDSGQSDGQAWFNGAGRTDNRGRVLPGVERFASIDAGYRKHCTGETLTKSGTWSLVSYVEGFDAQASSWKFSEKHPAIFEEWGQFAPDSSGGLWALARYWYLYAWDARGNRVASDVSESAWKLFRERLAKADEALKHAEQRPIGCPILSTLRLELMLLQGKPKGEMRKAFTDMQKKYSGYHPLYFGMAKGYEPRWGGSETEFERFAQNVIKLTSTEEGVGMYARLYANADRQRQIQLGKKELKPKWKTLQSGFEKLLQMYPDSEELAFQYLDFSCRVGDGKTYRKLRSRAVGFEESYPFREPLDSCDAAFGWREN